MPPGSFNNKAVCVSCTSPINPVEFVERVEPLLATKDVPGLISLLKTHWTKDQIKDLLASRDHDARKVAMLALSLVGTPCCVPTIAEQLKDEDPCGNQMAEHALWSIWFRSGTPQANALLAEGAEAMNQKDFASAERLFTEAIQTDRSFAEAYNQRAIVRYLTERYEESIADCKATVERMPCHFGAWSGMGHGYAHLGKIPEAIKCYAKALEINPHLECVAEGLRELRRQWRDGAK
jgi:Tfp pilus assembly protein PilF